MKLALLTMLIVIVSLPGQASAAGDGKTEAVKPTAEGHPLKELWSGYHYAEPEVRNMQDSEADNPAMVLFKKGEGLWKQVDGRANKSCASCHGDAAKSMRGAAATYPAFFKLTEKPQTLTGRINLCREKFMEARAFPYESEPLLALTIFVKRQSKGMALAVAEDGPLKPFLDKGKAYYTSRRGQLAISCAGCHEKYAGKRYRSEKLSQGHANGFPTYRKSWKTTGSLLKQINQCLARVRANPLKAGSDNLANLQLYLASKANGLVVETPAVRE